MGMIVIAFILLVIVIILSYVNRASMTDQRKKILSGLTITSAVVLLVTALFSVYQLSAISKAAVCMSS